ncbi:alpha/beta hydrolase [Nocardioides sp. GXZ039]|uniref:alpha/beta hydrolase n=1 Tax=Nocardioides sp. GXZ039 TaxID=3136018 RepID=UPI0030F45E33
MLSQEAEELLGAMPPRPPRASVDLDTNRRGLRAQIPAFAPPDEPLLVGEGLIAGVPVRSYRPPALEGVTAPCVVYAHGGGWALGDLDTHDSWCRRLSLGADCVVISVDYRQPPEHPYPAALDDVTAVVRAVLSNPDSHDVDPDLVCVAGDSAGGNLAAATAQRLAGSSPPLVHQLLILPVLDNRPERWPSYQEHAEALGLTRDDMVWYFEQYAGPRWSEVADPGLAPMRAESLAGLPTATVLTAECDPLRDEGEGYAARLVEAGVPTAMRRFVGTFHPFTLYVPRLEAAVEALDLCVARVREVFARER